MFEENPGRFAMWHVKDLDKTTQTFTEVGTWIINFKRIFANEELSGVKHLFVEQDVVKKNVFEASLRAINI